jgi:hypothetical protein
MTKPMDQRKWLAQLRTRIPGCVGCKIVKAAGRAMRRLVAPKAKG